MAAQQLNCMLTTLSHNLTIPDELLRRGNKYMQEIFLILQNKSEYKLDRCRLSGGVGKKTSISLKFDYDCVIYVNNVDPPFEKLLDEWDNILTLNFSKLIGNTRVTECSVQFEIDSFKFDILPAGNYAGPHNDIALQAKSIWSKISTNQSAGKKGNVSYLYSSGLSELALQFMRNQSPFIHDLCRLAKYWNCTVLSEQHVSGRSTIIECLAVKAGQEEEHAAINDKLSMLRAFRRFLSSFTENTQIGIVFLGSYGKCQVPAYKKPYLIDPSNPYNNFLADLPYRFLPALSKYSQETLDRLEKCEKNFIVEFEKLFDPQPNLRSLFEKNANVDSVNIMIGSYPNCNEKLPRLIVRRETFDSAALKKMKDLMTYVLEHLSTIFNAMPVEDIAEKIPEATKRFIDRSFYKRNDHWGPTTTKHEDYDITYILPLNTKKSHAVYISMTK